MHGVTPLEYVLVTVVLVLAVVIVFQIRMAASRTKLYAAEMIDEYKKDEKERIKQSIEKSLKSQRSVVKGKVWEQIAPYLPEFEHNPADARFIGDPVDYVVFSGMSNGGEIEVIMIDVKTGKAQLNLNQKRIRDAIDGGRVSFRTMRLKDKGTE